MTRFKDFGAGKSGAVTEPLSFKIHDEEFHCLPEIQGRVLLDLVSQSQDETRSAGVVIEFFDSVLTEESLKRFQDLVHSKDRIVSVETLGEITAWLIEEYTNRPEEQPEAS